MDTSWLVTGRHSSSRRAGHRRPPWMGHLKVDVEYGAGRGTERTLLGLVSPTLRLRAIS